MDISYKANRVIWGYFFLFAIILYLCIVTLSIYFRYEVEKEEFVKVGSVVSSELTELRAEEAEKLAHIDDAMNRVIEIYK